MLFKCIIFTFPSIQIIKMTMTSASASSNQLSCFIASVSIRFMKLLAQISEYSLNTTLYVYPSARPFICPSLCQWWSMFWIIWYFGFIVWHCRTQVVLVLHVDGLWQHLWLDYITQHKVNSYVNKQTTNYLVLLWLV